MAPKYMRVAASIRSRISEGALSPGDALPTEDELAEQHGVSRMTVRRAVEDLIEEGLVLRQQGRGTFVCERDNRETILYVGRVRGHFYHDRYVELMRECQDRGHRLLVFSTDEKSLQTSRAEHLQELVNEASAIICKVHLWDRIRATVPDQTAAVLLTGWEGREIETMETVDRVYVLAADGSRGADLATRHLIELGHTEIAYIGTCGADTAGPFPPVAEDSPEYQAFLRVLDSHGLQPAGSVGFRLDQGKTDEDWQEVAENAISEFVQQRGGWPTAFMCEGDFRASPLLRVAINDQLRLPDELSVVGMGNTPWAEMLTPQLTSISMGEAKMARLAVTLSKEDPPEETTILRVQPRLVERASTAPARGRCCTPVTAEETVSL
mgnify:CR=1 FL=1